MGGVVRASRRTPQGGSIPLSPPSHPHCHGPQLHDLASPRPPPRHATYTAPGVVSLTVAMLRLSGLHRTRPGEGGSTSVNMTGVEVAAVTRASATPYLGGGGYIPLGYIDMV